LEEIIDVDMDFVKEFGLEGVEIKDVDTAALEESFETTSNTKE